MLRRLLVFLLIIKLSAPLFCGEPDTLLIVHPTISNIQTFLFLSENGLFPVENYHFLGVFHEKEGYDYTNSANYLSEHNIKNFTLYEVNGTIAETSVFTSNQCSETFHQLFLLSEGAFFLGGPDIPPYLYTDSTNLLTVVTDPFRHYFELSFIFHLLGQNNHDLHRPFLEENGDYLVNGICLGMQSMNVACGGSLVQDIPTELYDMRYAENLVNQPRAQTHRNYYGYLEEGESGFTGYHFHKVKLYDDSFISSKMGYRIDNYPEVLSAHHQAVKEIGFGLKAAAESLDGKIIEAVEHEIFKNVFGVQFHPEKTGLFNSEDIRQVNSDSTINFNKFISEKGSLSFHQKYWMMLAEILNGVNATRSR